MAVSGFRIQAATGSHLTQVSDDWTFVLISFRFPVAGSGGTGICSFAAFILGSGNRWPQLSSDIAGFIAPVSITSGQQEWQTAGIDSGARIFDTGY